MSECIRGVWAGQVQMAPVVIVLKTPPLWLQYWTKGGLQSEGHNGHSLNQGVALYGSARGQHCLGQWSLGLGDLKAGQECDLVLPGEWVQSPVEFAVVANGGKTVLLTIELDWTLYGPYAGQFLMCLSNTIGGWKSLGEVWRKPDRKQLGELWKVYIVFKCVCYNWLRPVDQL